MPRRQRTKLGNVGPTLGWQKLVDWFEKEPSKNTMAELARVAGVRQPSVFSWRWLDKQISREHLPAVCRTIGASFEDFFTPLATKRRRGKAAA